MAERRDPWRELRSREHLILRFDTLAAEGGGAFYYRRGGRAAIVLDPGLTRRARRAAVAHELLHDQWGPCRHDDNVVVCREERRVGNEVARWLVPLDQLRTFLERRATTGEGITVIEVADEFDTTLEVAERAMRLAGAA